VVLVDEINLWAPSRLWNALPIGLLHRWAQVRKYRTQILWSAQHEDRVDKVIREVTGWIWECKPILLGRYFSLHAYEPSDLRRELTRKALGSSVMRLRPDIAEAYDTFRIVDVGSHVALTRGRPDRVGVEAARVAKGGLGADRHDTGWLGIPEAPGGPGLVGVHELDASGNLGDRAAANPR
jgi:hypothetical protein